MMTLIKKLAFSHHGLIFLTLIAVIFFIRESQHQTQTIQNQSQLIDQQSSRLQSLTQHLSQLQTLQESHHQQMKKLIKEQHHLQATLVQRQQQFRSLEHDIEEVRNWSHQSLPADLIRLRQSRVKPAQPSAVNRESVSASIAMPDHAKPTPDQR